MSPNGGPVITGKPGIRLVLSSFGFSQSLLPALCRQATSCAWRSRLRKILDRMSVEASAGGHFRATSANRTAINRMRSGFLRRPWRPDGQGATQEAQRNQTPMRAKRYAQCGLGDTCAQNHTNHFIFCTSCRDAKIASQTERAKRYTQCGFAGMKGLKRFMWQRVRCMFCNCAKTGPNGDGTKS